MTKPMLKIKTMFGQGLVPLAILAMAVLLVPVGLFAQTVAVDDFVITPPNQTVTIDVLANDTPPGTLDEEGITNTDIPNNTGTLTNNKDGTFTYEPAPDFSSPDPVTFEYTVCDEATKTSCDTAKVSIIVAIEVPLNIITRKLNVKKMGVLPVEIRTGEGFDLTTIDPESLMLQGARVLRWNMVGKKLILKFHARDIVSNLGQVNDRDVVVLQLTGQDLISGFAIVGEDPVIIINKGNMGNNGNPKK